MNLLRRYIRSLLIEATIPDVHPESIIFCDMDGVLVDFDTATVSLINSRIDEGELTDQGKTYRKTLRRMQREMGPDWRAKSRSDLDIKPVRNFMFAVISQNPGDFFGSLPPLHDGVNMLWPYITATGHAVKLLTAGVPGKPEMSTSEEGKKIWAIENLNPPPAEVILSPSRQKAEFARAGGVPNILIDDKVVTVQSWDNAGGIGILHVPGGSAATIARLQELGL